MLEDRSYMREPSFRGAWPLAIILMVVNVAVFALQQIAAVYLGFTPRECGYYFALSTEGLARGYLWQLLTFQFLHSGLWHLALNLIGIYFFGRFVEDRLGKSGFLKVYFLSGFLGGIFQVALAWIFPLHFPGSVVGASAGVFGLLAAFALLEPGGIILLFFVLPVRAKYLLWVAAGLALFYVVVPARDGVAHAAHLGGILGGVLYLRWRTLLEALQPARGFSRSRLRPRELMRVPAEKRPAWLRGKSDGGDQLSTTDFISREVDPILDKISAHGIHSLTEREREILERARTKMERRTRGG
jgi:membrane associated rhomboid family serine protease